MSRPPSGVVHLATAGASATPSLPQYTAHAGLLSRGSRGRLSGLAYHHGCAMPGCVVRSIARLTARAVALVPLLSLALLGALSGPLPAPLGSPPAMASDAPGPPAPAAAPGGAARAATAEDALWALLRDGRHVILMRHTSTVATAGFDPPGFRLDDCATQRSLSDFGRDEARGIGAAFRARGIPVGRILSSRWCRCLETARLAYGAVEAWPALDSFHEDRARAPAQTAEVKRLAGQRPAGGNLVLVTHEANVAAVTGLSPAPGEMIILTPTGDGGFGTAGRLLLSVRPSG